MNRENHHRKLLMICGIAVAVIVAVIWWVQQGSGAPHSIHDSLAYPFPSSSVTHSANHIAEKLFLEVIHFFNKL